MVESAPTGPPSRTGEESIQHADDVQNAEGLQGPGSNKRAVPDPADEEEGRWKLRKKITTVGLGEIYDPGVIAIKPKVKAEEVKEEETGSHGTSVPGDTKATPVPKWAPVKWKKAGEPADGTSGAPTSVPGGDTALTEGAPRAPTNPLNADEDPTPASVTDVSVKDELVPVKLEETSTPSGETASSGGSLFRKRKAPLGGGTSSRGRRF
jgi:WW domain-binding protein 4